jgi:hypothetical protein
MSLVAAVWISIRRCWLNPNGGKAIFRSREWIGIEARKAQKTTIPLQNSPLETIIKKINRRRFDKFRFFA